MGRRIVFLSVTTKIKDQFLRESRECVLAVIGILLTTKHPTPLVSPLYISVTQVTIAIPVIIPSSSIIMETKRQIIEESIVENHLSIQ
jgi:hypothetical protein